VAPLAAADLEGPYRIRVGSFVSVLVVEDDKDVRDSTAQLLIEAGYEVRRAASGPEALAQLYSGYRPAVILADYRMAGMNGAELFHAVRSDPTLTHISGILTSGFADEQVADIAGASGFLKKPFDPDRMLSLVARLAKACGPAV
jgi:two-component system, chemotaxis family, chemotaxis protein CheY